MKFITMHTKVHFIYCTDSKLQLLKCQICPYSLDLCGAWTSMDESAEVEKPLGGIATVQNASVFKARASLAGFLSIY